MEPANNILSRRALAPSSTPLQAQVDGLVGGFAAQAADWRSLAAMATGGMAYRAGRIGVMGLGNGSVLRAASVGVGLTAEVSTFEFTHRGLSSVALGANGRGPLHANLWSWNGSGGIRQGLLQSFVTFGALKGAGRLSQGQNVVAQHLFQDTAMVLGHQASGALGLMPHPTGTLAEQFLHAEATNLQMGAGMALAHGFAPGLQALERGLDLSLSAARSPRPRWRNSGMGAETAPLRQLALAEGGGRGPSPSDFILAMSSLPEGGGAEGPPAPRIFYALPRRGKKGTPPTFNLNPIPRQRWEAPNQVNVNELGISEGGILMTKGLTSCAALLFHDPIRGKGVLIHLQPPVISRDLETPEDIHQFVDAAVQRTLEELGGEIQDIRAMTMRSGIDPIAPLDSTRDQRVAGYLWSEAITFSLGQRGVSTRDFPLHQGIAEIQFNTASGEVKIDPYPATLQGTFDVFPTRPFFMPVHEPVSIDVRRYSVMDGQDPGLSTDLAVRPLGDGLFGFEGFGFMIFQGARGRLRNCGLIYCSRLAIFDPTTRTAVDSHLPVYFDDFEVFKSDLARSMEQLRRRGMNLESSRITLIYGQVVRPEDRSLGWFPGQKIAEMLKELGLEVDTALPADRYYDFDLETGEVLPVPEED